jgi:hypothetical protein
MAEPVPTVDSTKIRDRKALDIILTSKLKSYPRHFDADLWFHCKQDFEEWDSKEYTTASVSKIIDIIDILRTNRVFIRKTTEHSRLRLQAVIQKNEPHE